LGLKYESSPIRHPVLVGRAEFPPEISGTTLQAIPRDFGRNFFHRSICGIAECFRATAAGPLRCRVTGSGTDGRPAVPIRPQEWTTRLLVKIFTSLV
jgi:hypothetical protein